MSGNILEANDIPPIWSGTCQTRNSSLSGGFIDQYLALFNVRQNVFGKTITGDDLLTEVSLKYRVQGYIISIVK
jgi:hypothetical protein